MFLGPDERLVLSHRESRAIFARGARRRRFLKGKPAGSIPCATSSTPHERSEPGTLTAWSAGSGRSMRPRHGRDHRRRDFRQSGRSGAARPHAATDRRRLDGRADRDGRALVYAELADRRPDVGGQYAYLRDAYGPTPAFLTAGRCCW